MQFDFCHCFVRFFGQKIPEIEPFLSLQAELWVNPGPRGGVDPRQRARAQMPVSLVYWEDAATGTSARSGQGRERIEEDARVRAYAAYGLDGAE